MSPPGQFVPAMGIREYPRDRPMVATKATADQDATAWLSTEGTRGRRHPGPPAVLPRFRFRFVRDRMRRSARLGRIRPAERQEHKPVHRRPADDVAAAAAWGA